MSLIRSQIALTVALAAATAGGVGYAMHRSAVALAPVTHITTLDAGSKAARRALASTWADLAQAEIDALGAWLKALPSANVTIFCADEAKCGDLQADFENALETAHWPVKLEKPMIDTTVGLSTSSVDLKNAIAAATQGRLNAKLIPVTAPYFALVIGRKPRAGEPDALLASRGLEPLPAAVVAAPAPPPSDPAVAVSTQIEAPQPGAEPGSKFVESFGGRPLLRSKF
jgi:hypothetical protein